MSSEHFCLKWNNFEYNIAAYLNALRNGDEFVDVTLTCSEQSFKAHKLILSACSPYFHQIFQDNPCKHPVIILKNVSAAEMESILMYIYTGEAYVAEENISSFFSTAQLLQIVGLTYNNLSHKKIDITTEEGSIPERNGIPDHLKSSFFSNEPSKPKPFLDTAKNFQHNPKSNILKNHLNYNCLKLKTFKKSNVSTDKDKIPKLKASSDSSDLHKNKNSDSDIEGSISEHCNSEEDITIDFEKVTTNAAADDNTCHTIDNTERAEFEERCPILSQQLLLPKKRKLSADYNKNIEIVSENDDSSNKIPKLIYEESNSSENTLDRKTDTPISKEVEDKGSDILRNRLFETVVKESSEVDAGVTIKTEPVDEFDEPELESEEQNNYLEPEVSVKEEFTCEVDNDEDSTPFGTRSVPGLSWSNLDESSTGEGSQGGCASAFNTILKVPNPDISLFSKSLKKSESVPGQETESSHLSLTPNVEIFLRNTSENSNDLLQNLGKTNFFQKPCHKTKSNKKQILIKQLSLLPNLDITKIENCDKKASTSKEDTSLLPSKGIPLKCKSDVKAIQKSELQKILVKSDNKFCQKSEVSQKTLHNNFNLTNFPCPHCKQPYSNLSALKYHVRLMHSDLENMLYCYLCPMSFIEREYFKAHLWETHNARF